MDSRSIVLSQTEAVRVKGRVEKIELRAAPP